MSDVNKRRHQYLTKAERLFFDALFLAIGCGLVASIAKLIADVT